MYLSQRVMNFDPNDKNTSNFTRLADLSQCQEKPRHRGFLRTLSNVLNCLLETRRMVTHTLKSFSAGQVTGSLTATGVALWNTIPGGHCVHNVQTCLREPTLMPVCMWWWTAGAAAGLFLILSCDKGFQRVKCLYKAKVKHLSAAKASQYEAHWYGSINPCAPKVLKTTPWLLGSYLQRKVLTENNASLQQGWLKLCLWVHAHRKNAVKDRQRC